MVTHCLIPRNIVVDGETAVQEHDDAYQRRQGQQLSVNAKPGKVEAYFLPKVFSEGRSKSDTDKALWNRRHVNKHQKAVVIFIEEQYVKFWFKKLPDEINRLILVKCSVSCPFIMQQLKQLEVFRIHDNNVHCDWLVYTVKLLLTCLSFFSSICLESLKSPCSHTIIKASH